MLVAVFNQTILATRTVLAATFAGGGTVPSGKNHTTGSFQEDLAIRGHCCFSAQAGRALPAWTGSLVGPCNFDFLHQVHGLKCGQGGRSSSLAVFKRNQRRWATQAGFDKRLELQPERDAVFSAPS